MNYSGEWDGLGPRWPSALPAGHEKRRKGGTSGMIVSHARRFVFLHNPKTAGSSFRAMLDPYHDHPTRFWDIAQDPYFNSAMDMAHPRLWELAALVPPLFADLDNYLTLVFVRDPVSRFLSACAEHFRRFRAADGFDIADSVRRRALIHQLIGSGAIEAGVRGDYRFIHFSPQFWFTHLGTRRVARHVLKLRAEGEDFAEALALLRLPAMPARHDNSSAGADWDAVQDEGISGFVHRFYARDYAMLAELGQT